MKTIKWAAAATSVTTGADATSMPVTLKPKSVGVNVQLAWTGTTTGTVKMQGSNDLLQWNDVASMTASPAGSAGTAVFTADKAYWDHFQVVFTRSGGTGLISGTYNEK